MRRGGEVRDHLPRRLRSVIVGYDYRIREQLLRQLVVQPLQQLRQELDSLKRTDADTNMMTVYDRAA